MRVVFFAINFTAFVLIATITIWAGSLSAPAGVMIVLIGTALWALARAVYEALK